MPSGTLWALYLAAENDESGGQFHPDVSEPQSTIDYKEEKEPTRQTWKPPTKNQNSPKIDQNAKQHENRQNDVIFTA